MVPSRLILDAPASGSWNMAVDGAMLESVAAGSDPCLRFYGWKPATLSLGYFQATSQRNVHIGSASLPVVRRSTGGGAIVHEHELTYSLVVPAKTRFSPGGAQLVADIHEALIQALAQWNVAVTLVDPCTQRRSQDEPFLCFQRRASGDVILSDYKICGSALRQRHGATLVHGSVLVAKSRYASELPGINNLTARPVPVGELTAAWTQELGTKLEFTFERDRLSDSEVQRARQLESRRYAAAAWTLKR